jgi:hypothetical protein
MGPTFVAINRCYDIRRLMSISDKGGETMKPSHLILASGLFLTGTFMVGCSMGTGETQQTSLAPCGSDYSCIKDLAFQYRQQAEQLSAIAQRYEHEAALKSAQAGNDAEDIKRQHELAQQYFSESQKADDLAQQYRRQLPHNMMY